MKREIKFRGQRTDNGLWVFGGLVIDPDGNYRIYFKPFPKASSNTFYFIKLETFGQLWRPSLGIECYGGDLFKAICAVDDPHDCVKKERIVKIIETDSGHHVVVWHHRAWWGYSKMDFTSFKHIGNIYENQDLLT